jgi:hypothetical protein
MNGAPKRHLPRVSRVAVQRLLTTLARKPSDVLGQLGTAAACGQLAERIRTVSGAQRVRLTASLVVLVRVLELPVLCSTSQTAPVRPGVLRPRPCRGGQACSGSGFRAGRSGRRGSPARGSRPLGRRLGAAPGPAEPVALSTVVHPAQPTARVECSGVVASPESVRRVCGKPPSPRKRETCSDRCRTELNRQRRAAH